MKRNFPAPAAQLAIARYLQHRLETRLSPKALEWLSQKRGEVARSASPLSLCSAFGAAPRRVGKAALALDEAELTEAAAIRQLWRPDRWSADQAARCLLLLACDASDPESHVANVERLFSTADARELVALYQTLPLLPHPQRYCMRAAEGVRSGMVNVFHAVALNNPYPFEWFDEPAWNRMVLKVAFTGSPMREIIGLDARANPALARMLRDLAHERRAAGRAFPAEVWQLMAPYADEAMIRDFHRALEDEDESHRAAAAAALEKTGHRYRTADRGVRASAD